MLGIGRDTLDSVAASDIPQLAVDHGGLIIARLHLQCPGEPARRIATADRIERISRLVMLEQLGVERLGLGRSIRIEQRAGIGIRQPPPAQIVHWQLAFEQRKRERIERQLPFRSGVGSVFGQGLGLRYGQPGRIERRF